MGAVAAAGAAAAGIAAVAAGMAAAAGVEAQLASVGRGGKRARPSEPANKREWAVVST